MNHHKITLLLIVLFKFFGTVNAMNPPQTPESPPTELTTLTSGSGNTPLMAAPNSYHMTRRNNDNCNQRAAGAIVAGCGGAGMVGFGTPLILGASNWLAIPLIFSCVVCGAGTKKIITG